MEARNFCVRKDGDKLIIEIDLTKDLGPSSTGKSTMVASSKGWMPLECDRQLAINFNLTRKPRGEWRPVRGVA